MQGRILTPLKEGICQDCSPLSDLLRRRSPGRSPSYASLLNGAWGPSRRYTGACCTNCPRMWLNDNKGSTICFGLATIALGPLVLARFEQHICTEEMTKLYTNIINVLLTSTT
ncbi:hypothetical protein F444_04320, partial [Phytophthora nicotianae P1976]